MGGFDALDLVAGRHADVGHDRIRVQPVDGLAKLAAVLDRGDHLDLPRGFQQTPGPLPDEIVIVGNDDADHRWLVSMGRRAVSTVPPPGRVSIATEPANAANRSLRPARPFCLMVVGSNPTPSSPTLRDNSPFLR